MSPGWEEGLSVLQERKQKEATTLELPDRTPVKYH